jgi:hypothetical protein
MTARDFKEFDFADSRPVSLTLWLLNQDLDHYDLLVERAIAEGNVQAALFWGMACFHLGRFIDANW